MNRVAVLITVFNRLDKTIKCLDALFASLANVPEVLTDIYVTDDGSTDSTSSVLRERYAGKSLLLLQGDGNLFWNGGMNHSWRAALKHGGYDGYLWLNNDTVVFTNLWQELREADAYAYRHFGKRGVYIGSTCNAEGKLTYGGFDFVNRWTLKDKFLIPDGKNFQSCQCGHGNVTYISHEVTEVMGVLCDGYHHGGGDHDYTYLAYKKGFPVFILREFVGQCENDHKEDGFYDFVRMGLKERIRYLNSPLGYNLHNTLLFQKRCFPYRYPMVWIAGYARALFPKMYMRVYRTLRK